MEIWVEGMRATEQSRSAAYHAPASDLPGLTFQERNRALASGWTEERYARTKYAGELGAREWAKRVETVAVLLQDLLEQRAPASKLLSLTLNTSRGIYRATAEVGNASLEFQVRENVVDDLIEAGDAEALSRLRRVVEIATLPYMKPIRVS